MNLFNFAGRLLAFGLLGLASSLAAQASMPVWRGVEVRQLVQSPTDPETVYAIGNGFFYRSDDRGQKWKPLRAPKSIEFAELHVDPNDGRHVLILARERDTSGKPSLHESFDRGQTWVARAPISFSNADGSNGGSFFPTRLFVPAQQGPSDWLAYDGRRFRSSDGGRNWVRQQGGPLDVEAVPERPLRFGLEGNIFWRSLDAGQTWDNAHIFDDEAKDAGRGRTPSNLLALSEKELVVRDSSGNWLQSNDRGDHWVPASNGFQHLNRSSPMTGSEISTRAFGETLCSVRRSPAPGAAAILLARCIWGNGALPSATCFHFSNDAGRTWTPPRSAGSIPGESCQQEGLRKRWEPTALLLDVADPKRMLVAWQAGGLFRSEDGGQSWHASDTGLMFRSAHGPQIERLALGEPSLIQAVLYRDRELLQRNLASGADINMEGNAFGGVLEADIFARLQEVGERGKSDTPAMWLELRKAGASSFVSRTLQQTLLMSAMTLKSDEVVDDLVQMGYDWGLKAGSSSARPEWPQGELHDLLQNAERLGLTAFRTRELISAYIRAGRFPSSDQTTLDLLNNGYADLAMDVMKASTRAKPFDRQSTPRKTPDLPIAAALLLARKSAEAKSVFATIPLARIRAHTIEARQFIEAIGVGCDLTEASWYKVRGVPIKLSWTYEECLSDKNYPVALRLRMLRAMRDDSGIPPESWNRWLDDEDKRWVTKTNIYKTAMWNDKMRGTGVIGVVLDSRAGSDYFEVSKLIAGLPAAAQGVLEGDAITAVDGRTTDLQSLRQVIARIAGQPGTWVQLGILRNGRPMSFRIQRQIRPSELDGATTLKKQDDVGDSSGGPN